MSDFFSLLSRRALQPAAIRPRLPSRFEGDSALPVAPPSEAEVSSPLAVGQPSLLPPAPTLATPAASSGVSPQAPQLKAAPEARAPGTVLAAPEPGLSLRAAPEQRGPLPATPPSVAPLLSPPLLPVPLAAQLVSSNREPATAGESHAPHDVQTHTEHLERHELSREVIERQVERLLASEPTPVPAVPALVAMPPLAPPSVAAVPATPRVEINIGRIEVLPLEPVAAPRREEAAKRPATQSLEAYLQERNGNVQGRGGRG